MRLPEAHEHLCHTVGDEESLRKALQAFLSGLQGGKGRNGIFVHRYSEERAWELLESAGPARALAAQGRLSVVGRIPAFQAGGAHIDFGHVAEVVEQAATAADAQGRGLSILADASHAYLHESRAAEWFAFEVWLGRRLARNITLVCIYWNADMNQDVRAQADQTHLYDLAAAVPAASA